MKKIRPLIWSLAVMLLGITSAIFLFKFINPQLINFKQQTLFLTGSAFFSSFMEYPGGLSEYLSLFFSQFFVSRVAGTLIILAFAAANAVVLYYLAKKHLGQTISLGLAMTLGVLLTGLHASYEATLQTSIVLLISSLSVFFIQLFNTRKNFFKIPLIVFLGSLMYFYFGSTALMTFTALFTATTLYKKDVSNYLSALLLIGACFALPAYTSATSAYMGYKEASLGVLEPGQKPFFFVQLITFLISPILILLSPLKKKMSIKPLAINILHIIVPITLIAFATVFYIFSFNKDKKNNLLFHYQAKNKQWAEVISIGKELSLNDRKVPFQLNRAYYHQNMLIDKAFEIPQYWGERGFILTTHYNSEVLMLCSDLYYDMGHIKASLHWAYEAQTKFPFSPDVIQRIILCNLILNEFSTAEHFIDMLSRSVIYRKWAEQQRKFLNKPQLVSSDSELGEKQKFTPDEDFFTNQKQPLYDLSMLLKKNPGNKMAFEYYMIDAMLTHDLAKMEKEIHHMGSIGYKKIPVHLEEAILLFSVLNKEKKIDTGHYTVSQETHQRFRAYSELMMKYRNKMKQGESEFRQGYKDTYWYYIHFVSPITTKREFKEKQ
jgi:hypothetical protein